MTDTSDDSLDKLQAVVVQRMGAADGETAYGAACSEWFAKLTDVERALTDAAMIIYENGDKPGAAQILANLPPAPKRPRGA